MQQRLNNWVIIRTFFMLSSFFISGAAFSSQAPYDTYKNRLFVVHASNSFPIGGEFVPGKKPYPEVEGALANASNDPVLRAKVKCNQFGGCRPCISVAIGELVRPHGLNTWEECHVAYVAPWTEVSDQVYSLQPYDTALVGGLRLANSDRSVLVVSEAYAQKYKESIDSLECNVAIFNPEKVTLRKRIEDHITASGGDLVKMQAKEGSKFNLEEDSNLTAMLNGDVDISQSEFWAQYLKSHPHVFFGYQSFNLLRLADKYDFLFKEGLTMPALGHPCYVPSCMFKLGREIGLWALQHEAVKVQKSTVYSEEAKASFLRQVDTFCSFAGIAQISSKDIVTDFNRKWNSIPIKQMKNVVKADDVGPISMKVFMGHAGKINSFMDFYNAIFAHALGRMKKAEVTEFMASRFQRGGEHATEDIQYRNIIFAGYSLIKFIETTEKVTEDCAESELKTLLKEQYLYAATLSVAAQALPKGNLSFDLFILYMPGVLATKVKDRDSFCRNISNKSLKALRTGPIAQILKL